MEHIYKQNGQAKCNSTVPHAHAKTHSQHSNSSQGVPFQQPVFFAAQIYPLWRCCFQGHAILPLCAKRCAPVRSGLAKVAILGISNGGTPKSFIMLMGFSIINHPLWGIPLSGNHKSHKNQTPQKEGNSMQQPHKSQVKPPYKAP